MSLPVCTNPRRKLLMHPKRDHPVLTIQRWREHSSPCLQRVHVGSTCRFREPQILKSMVSESVDTADPPVYLRFYRFRLWTWGPCQKCFPLDPTALKAAPATYLNDIWPFLHPLVPCKHDSQCMEVISQGYCEDKIGSLACTLPLGEGCGIPMWSINNPII